MKKFASFVFALFLTAGVAFAQNDASIDQQTSGSDAKIEQTGANSGANALSGEAAGAYIKQYGGDDNEAFINQEGAQNRGVIEQNGTRNFARDLTRREQPGIDQRGDENWSNVYQEGSLNEVNTFVLGSSNQLDIYQVGERNETFFRVGGDDGTADIDQTGTDNQISIRAAGNTPRNPALATPGSNDFVLIQSGVGGHRIFGNVGGMDNQITVTQEGSNNFLGGDEVTRTGSFLVDGDLNTVTVDQFSDGNAAAVSVVGDGNSAVITQ